MPDPNNEMPAPPSTEGAVSDLDENQDGTVSLAEIADAIGAFVEGGDIPPEAAADLSKAQELIEKWSTREEVGALDDAEQEPAPPVSGGDEQAP